MARGDDDSLIRCSLTELMTLEEDRVHTEEREHVRAIAATEQARVAAERRAHAAERQRIAAEQKRRTREEQQAREATARLAAIHEAEIAKVQTETEQRARSASVALKQDHERKLAALHHDRTNNRLRSAVVTGAAIAVIGGALGGFFLVRAVDTAERERLTAAQEQAARDNKHAQNLRAQRETEARIAAMKTQLARLEHNTAEASALREQLARVQHERGGSEPISRVGHRTPGHASTPQATQPTRVACAPGDPLCTDID